MVNCVVDCVEYGGLLIFLLNIWPAYLPQILVHTNRNRHQRYVFGVGYCPAAHDCGILHALPQGSALICCVERVLQPCRALALIVLSGCGNGITLSTAFKLLKVIVFLLLAAYI